MSRDWAVVDKLLLSLKSIGTFDLELLRQDDWGACFKASDPNRRIAISIKTVWPQDASQEPESLVQGLKSQAQVAQSLVHPNIAKAIGSGELEGAVFLVTSYIHGLSLRETLQRSERLNTWDLIDVARQVTLGLEYAHSRGAIHHALHPGNIILEHDGATQIVDFGWYRGNVPAGEPLTPAAFYLAPEQYEEEPASAATNLYSLALVLYEIATGKQPFRGDNWAEVLANAEDPIPPAIDVNNGVPPGISAALMRALSRHPEERFQSGNELVRALENYRAAEKPASPKPAPVTPLPTDGLSAPRPSPIPPPMAVRPFEPEKPKIDPNLDLESQNRSRVADVRPALMSFQDVLEWSPLPQGPSPVEEPFEPPKPPAWKVALNKIGSAVYTHGRDVLKRVDPWAFVLVSCVLLLVGFVGRTVYRSIFSQTQPVTFEQPTPTPAPSATPDESAQSMEENDASEAETASSSGGGSSRSRSRRNSRSSSLAYIPTVTVANPGSLSVVTVPAGAQVAIDDKPGQVFTTPQIISQLSPGVHTVRISKAGYEPASRQVAIVTGAIAKVAIQLDAPRGYLSVTSNPPGAFIVIDGQNTSRVTPSQVAVAPGQHTLTVRQLGYLEESMGINIASGERQARNVNLLVAGSTPEIRVVGNRKLFGSGKVAGVRISVATQPPGARITVNGQEVGKATPVDFSLNPGNYVFNISMDGYRPVRKVVNVQDGRPVTLNERLVP